MKEQEPKAPAVGSSAVLEMVATCEESDLDTDLDTMHFITDNKVRSQNGSSL